MKRTHYIISIVFVSLLTVMFLNAKSEIFSNGKISKGEPVIINLPPANALPAMEIKKAKGKYKYKKDDADDAQQAWIVAGECPTTHSSFETISSFNIRLNEVSDTDAASQSVYVDSSAIKGRKKNRFKQKFSYFKTTYCSGHHHIPSYGFFKAQIKDGVLKYMYMIKKAKEGGLMVKTNDYSNFKTTMAESNKVVSTVNVESYLSVNSETYYAQKQFEFTAKKKSLHGKVK